MPRIVFGNYKNSIPNFTPYHQNIITQKPKKYNLNIDNYIGDVDSFGTLQDPTEPGELDMSDVWEFPSHSAPGSTVRIGYLQKAFYNNSGLTGNVLLGGKNFQQNALKDCFAYSNITGLEFTELQSINPNGSYNPLSSTDLKNCPMLETVVFDELETIGTAIAFQQTFRMLPRLTTFEAPRLRVISGQNAFQEGFYGTSSLTSIDFSGLETLDNATVFGAAFAYTGLTEVEFPALTYAFQQSFYNAWYYCSYLTEARFPVLSDMGSNAFMGAFGYCTALTDVYFGGVTASTFNDYSSKRLFRDMLRGCSGVTVHFPTSVQSTVSDLMSGVDFSTGFTGTNTSIVCDL